MKEMASPFRPTTPMQLIVVVKAPGFCKNAQFKIFPKHDVQRFTAPSRSKICLCHYLAI